MYTQMYMYKRYLQSLEEKLEAMSLIRAFISVVWLGLGLGLGLPEGYVQRVLGINRGLPARDKPRDARVCFRLGPRPSGQPSARVEPRNMRHGHQRQRDVGA